MIKKILIKSNNNLLSYDAGDKVNIPYNNKDKDYIPLPETNSSTELTTNINSEVSGFFKIKSIGGFLHNFIQIILVIASISTFIYLLWGGLEYIISGGEQEKVKSAKSKITQAITGLVITAVVWIFWRLIIYFLGLSSSAQGTFDIKLPSP
ncbi:MAG: hypothetical protein U9Q63_00370 [Patescibacteria group bacterium]|nr:hypothetical protein [Patescibacteria group bacterium]